MESTTNTLPTSEFGYDPMWDDYGDGEGSFAEKVEYDEDEIDEYFHELPSNVPIDDNEIVEQSKQWVHTFKDTAVSTN